MLLLITMTSSFGQESVHDWPSFRAGAKPAVADMGNYPTHWDVATKENVRWKTAIHGRGNSSPIVFQNTVIVTTAYPSAASASSSQQLAGVMTVAQLVISLLLGLCVASDVSCIVRDRRHLLIYSSRAVFVASAGLSMLLLLDIGPQLFDYERCPIRSWLGSHLAASLGAAIALSMTIRRPWLRRINTVILVLIGFSLLIFIPARDHAYRGAGPQSFVVIGSGLFPLVLAAAMYAIYAFRDRGSDENRNRRNPFLGILAFSVLALAVCIGTVASASRVDHLSTMNASAMFISMTTVNRFLGSSVFALFSSVLFWEVVRRYKLKTGANQNPLVLRLESTLLLVSVIASSCLGISLCGLIFNVLTSHSTFLQYHLPAPAWDRINYMPVLVNLIVFLIAAAVTVLLGQKIRGRAAFLCLVVTLLMMTLWPLHVAVANSTHHESDLVRAVIAINRHDGSQKWVWEGLAGTSHQVHRENTQATSTPVTDGHRLVAWFGSSGLVCLDIASGKPLWIRTDLDYQSTYGAATSLAVANQNVIVISDAPVNPRITAVAIDSGQTVWERDRSMLIERKGNIAGHSRTPLVLDQDGRKIIVVFGWEKLICYDAAAGDEVARFEANSDGDHVASAACDEKYIYFGSPRQLVAISRQSLLTDSMMRLWQAKSNSNCVSPVTDGRYAFTCSDEGVVNCVDVRSGRIHWRERLEDDFRSSPIVAGGNLYLANLNGTMHVLNVDDPDHAWTKLEFGEPIFATPAAVDSQIFVRTESSLYLLQSASDRLQKTN